MSTVVGNNVRTLRESRGLSFEDLARRAGMTKSGVWMIEQGKSSPTMTSLEKIARALSTPVSELVREDAVTQ
jgi:transcriptional regulator with XRE-family HTH domain